MSTSVDLSGDHNKLALSYGAEMLDETAWGDDTRISKAGLLTVGAVHEGFWQCDGTSAVDDVLWGKFATADEVMTVCPTTGAAGEVAYTLKSAVARYSPGAEVGAMLAFTVEASGTGKLVRATVMETGAKTSTATGTARELGAATAAQTIYAAMHITAVSGTNPTLDMVLQSDDAEGFTDPTDRITFTQADAVGAEWKDLGGEINDTWWRLSWTVGGTETPSFTVLVVVGIL